MYLDPRAVFMLAVLVGVTGWVIKGLMVSLFKLRRESASSSSLGDIDERLKKIETAMSGVIMDVAAIREKERFMARLQASSSGRETPAKNEAAKDSELTPFMTQNIPVTSRMQR